MQKVLFLCLVGIVMLGSCTINRKIRDGETAFERKQYSLAVSMLQEEYEGTRFRDVRASKAYLIGLSFERMNRPEQSIRWYRAAYESGYGSQALNAYADALREDQQYDNAAIAYRALIEDYGTSPEWERALESCTAARLWIEQQAENPYEVRNWSANSSASDYAPVFYEDGRVIFTSDRNESTGDNTYMWTGNDFMDLFIATTGGQEVDLFSEKFNTAGNEGTMAFDKNFTRVFFTRCSSDDATDAYCKLFHSWKEGGFWTVPVSLPFQKEGVNYGHPAVSDDGQTLIYASDDPEGFGGYDLYRVYRRGSEWLDPEILPDGINTPGDEMFPGLHGDTLYFSSDEHLGMGGLDIFRSHRINADEWSPATNMAAPINSGGDDFAFVVDPFYSGDERVLQRGFYTSSRKGGQGNDDIYLFEKVHRIGEEPETDEVRYTIRVQGRVLEQLYREPGNPNSEKSGTAPLPGSTVEVEYDGSKFFPEVDPYGNFTMELDFDKMYTFLASREGYLTNDYSLDTRMVNKVPENPETVFIVDIILDKIYLNTEIVLENIYYDYDKWDIRPDAEPVLESLAELMFNNPSIRIELGSHTDCRGDDRYNMTLSQKRAQSAVDFLIAAGVSRSRIRPVGYGESRLKVQCECEECTEEEHQINRRTTFKVVQ